MRNVIHTIKDEVRFLVRQAYNGIRPVLPNKTGVFFNVPVRELRLFDTGDTQHEKKAETLEELRRNVYPGDEVIVIGGARGLAAVVAARRVIQMGESLSTKQQQNSVN